MKIVSNGAPWAGCIVNTGDAGSPCMGHARGYCGHSDWAMLASIFVISFSPQESLVSPSTVFCFNGKIE